MKKLALVLAMVLCVCMCSSAFAHSINKSIGEVPQYSGEIVIDGVKEDIYNYGLIYVADQEVPGTSETPVTPVASIGATAKLYSLYNGTVLYYFVEVADPTVTPHNTDVKLFRNECLEIAWDFTNAALTEDGRMKFMIPADGAIASETRGSITLDALTVASAYTETGYVIELAVDTAKIEGVSVAPGAQIGFVYFVDDIRTAADPDSDRGGIMPVITLPTGYHAEITNTPLAYDYFVLGTAEAVVPAP